jgi:hypothetical protein
VAINEFASPRIASLGDNNHPNTRRCAPQVIKPRYSQCEWESQSIPVASQGLLPDSFQDRAAKLARILTAFACPASQFSTNDGSPVCSLDQSIRRELEMNHFMMRFLSATQLYRLKITRFAAASMFPAPPW